MNKKLLPLLILFIFTPLLLLAQSQEELNNALNSNEILIQQLGQLGPMAFNPYITIFTTSLFSMLDIKNQFIATNPFFNNWFVLITSGILLSFTSIVKLFGDKINGPLRTVINFLDNKASVIITCMIIITPTVLGFQEQEDLVLYQASFVGVTIKMLLILIASIYYLTVVMAIRLFIEILIFLSPIPIIDTLFEIFKIVFTVGFVVLSIFYPTVSFIFSIFIFLISLILYRRAKSSINKIKYLIIYPILKFLSSDKNSLVELQPQSKLLDRIDLSIPILIVKNKFGYKRHSILWLINSEKKNYIVQKKIFRKPKINQIELKNCYIKKGLMYSRIESKDKETVLFLNKNYSAHLKIIAEKLNIIFKESGNDKNEKSLWLKLQNSISKEEKKELKTI